MRGQGFVNYILPPQISLKFKFLQTKKDIKNWEKQCIAFDDGEQQFGVHI